MNIFGVISSPIICYSFISIDLSLHYLFKGWWYLHTTEEGPGISRSEGGLQQSKFHFFFHFHPLQLSTQHYDPFLLPLLLSAPVVCLFPLQFLSLFIVSVGGINMPFNIPILYIFHLRLKSCFCLNTGIHPTYTSSIDWNNIIESFVNRC